MEVEDLTRLIRMARAAELLYGVRDQRYLLLEQTVCTVALRLSSRDQLSEILSKAAKEIQSTPGLHVTISRFETRIALAGSRGRERFEP